MFITNHTKFSLRVTFIAACCVPCTSAVAALWTPKEISTIGWYDASDGTTVVTSGTNVTAWKDKSGNGHHLDTVPAGENPAYGDGSKINGMNVIHLNNVYDELCCAGIPSINLTQLTVISVGMPKAAGDYPNLGSVYSTDFTDKLNLRLQNDGTHGRITSGLRLNGVNTNITSAYTNAFFDDTPVMLSAYYDGLNGVSRLNGGIKTVTENVADGATFTINEIQIGRDDNTPKNFHAEMVILDTADLDTIQLVEGYMAWKWGMQASLPVGHAYKDAAPTIIP